MYSVTRNNNQAHVIVCGNEKGGSGKTTTLMHLAVALMNAGYRIATIDLDIRQRSFTRYIKNREKTAKQHDIDLSMPTHFTIKPDTSDMISVRDDRELGSFIEIISVIEKINDFILIDTPGHDGYLMRLAHSMADTLITPMNDSYVDFDVLGYVDPETGEVEELSHYAQTVREARRQRRIADNGLLDWVVVRNRLTQIGSRNKQSMYNSLQNLSMQLGCRLADGISDRVIFRELFPLGLTVLDELDEEITGKKESPSHASACQEVRNLISTLRLPIDELSRKREETRKKWFQAEKKPLNTIGYPAE